ncbi:MAG: hypothetical protein COA99_01240 [Moraxellaceae bacterium]|nr:MAG: hypothetical protein COA99_01240 [Moraxellaceae bacterium]
MSNLFNLQQPTLSHALDPSSTQSANGDYDGYVVLPIRSSYDAEAVLSALLEDHLSLEEVKEIARIPATDSLLVHETLIDMLLNNTLSISTANNAAGNSAKHGAGSSTSIGDTNPSEMPAGFTDISDVKHSRLYSRDMQAQLLTRSHLRSAVKTTIIQPTLSNNSTTSKSQAPQYKYVVEISGPKHSGKQRLLLKDNEGTAILQTARRDSKTHHRSLVEFKALENTPKSIFLDIPMSGGPNLQLPLLTKSMPVNKDKTQTCWKTVISAIKPLRFLGDTNDMQQSDVLPEGWLYVFWRGQCWRELKVNTSNNYRDVDINWYRQTQAHHANATIQIREAKGHWLESIWIPTQLEGTPQIAGLGFQLAFSPSQWPLHWIETLEQSPAQRAQYCTALDGLTKYTQDMNFHHCDENISDIANALKNRKPHNNDSSKHCDTPICPDGSSLRFQREHNLAAVYLRPAGDVMRLKLTNKLGKPWQGRKMAISVGGNTTEYIVDAQGHIDIPLLGEQTIDNITAWTNNKQSPSHQISVKTGQLDDVSTVKGQQARLNNLQHNAGVEDGLMGRNTRQAIKGFQIQYKLDADGLAGPITQGKLTEIHGS